MHHSPTDPPLPSNIFHSIRFERVPKEVDNAVQCSIHLRDGCQQFREQTTDEKAQLEFKLMFLLFSHLQAHANCMSRTSSAKR